MIPKMTYNEFQENIRLAAEMTNTLIVQFRLPQGYTNIIFNQTLLLLNEKRLSGMLPVEYYNDEGTFEQRLYDYLQKRLKEPKSIEEIRIYKELLKFMQVG